MPVQTVLRDGQDFRGLAGTISSGSIGVGDAVVDATTGRQARIARIATMDGDLQRAGAGKAVALVLDADLDVARGAVLGPPGALPIFADSLDARLVWLADRPLDTRHGLLLRTATDVVAVSGIEITGHVELETLSLKPANTCSANDIVAATIALGRPTALNAFAGYPGTGSFLLVDPLGGGTLAAGVVVSARAWERTTADKPRTPFRVTSRLPATGLCSDLGRSEADVREFDRRSHEVARLFEAAGLSFILDLDPASESGGGI